MIGGKTCKFKFFKNYFSTNNFGYTRFKSFPKPFLKVRKPFPPPPPPPPPPNGV